MKTPDMFGDANFSQSGANKEKSTLLDGEKSSEDSDSGTAGENATEDDVTKQAKSYAKAKANYRKACADE